MRSTIDCRWYASADADRVRIAILSLRLQGGGNAGPRASEPGPEAGTEAGSSGQNRRPDHILAALPSVPTI